MALDLIRGRSRHPVNQAMVDDAPLGARIADAVTTFHGQLEVHHRPDRGRDHLDEPAQLCSSTSTSAPFILLNLAFSTQAAYAAPLILLAGNYRSLRRPPDPGACGDGADVEEEQNERLLSGNTEIAKRSSRLERSMHST